LATTVQWDPDLNAVRVENGLVLGVKCGVQLANPDPGDIYFQLISATFIDEVEASGQHNVYVDALDENGHRLNGLVVEHGWPWERYPQYDDVVTDTVFGDHLAQWGLYAGYDANKVPCGPYWVQIPGAKSDVFYGLGLPWNRHVSYVAVFQRKLATAPPPLITDPLEGIRNAAWNALFPPDGVNYNPNAAFAAYARSHSLGVPTTQEIDYKGFRFQGYAGGIAYAKIGEWDKIQTLPW